MALSLSLPRSSSLTDELLDAVPLLDAADLDALRRRAGAALAVLAERLPAGERLVLDGFRLRAALRRPESLARPEDAFSASPARCRRSVGLAAVERCLRRRAAGPSQAVASVLADGAEDAAGGTGGEAPRAPWWAPWYAGLAPGARAVVAAEATTWATQLWTSLDWRRLPAPVVVGGPDDWWSLPGRRISLRGRSEVRVRLEGRSVLVVVGSALPDAASRSELLFASLVPALAGAAGSAPGRVVGLWPAAGQVRVVPVDASALQEALDVVASVAAIWVDALRARHRRRGD